jgi:hypothetical protein
MSLGKNSIDCILSGTLGDKVWVNRNGKNYTRSKPASVANPRTPEQLVQRTRFSVIVRFLQPLKLLLRVGFKNDSVIMSPFNAAMGFNLKHAIIGTYPEYEIEYSKVLVSRSPLPEALNPSAVSNCVAEIVFSWDDNSSRINARADDKALLVVYSPVRQKAEWVLSGQTRIGGIQNITLSEGFSGDEVHCYMAFQNASQRVVSDSRFVGSLRVI